MRNAIYCGSNGHYYHKAYIYLVPLHICHMQDDKSGLYKGRLQMKSIPRHVMPGGRRPGGDKRPAYDVRCTNGQTCPGILCPESLLTEVTSVGKKGGGANGSCTARSGSI